MPSPNASPEGQAHASKHSKQWIDLLLNAATTDGTPVGSDVVQALVRLARGQDVIITLLENLAMALTAEEQAIADDLNAATTKIGNAVSTATAAITDLAAKVAAGSLSPADFAAAITPVTANLNTLADGLVKTASDADPIVNPAAPPIPVPETPVP